MSDSSSHIILREVLELQLETFEGDRHALSEELSRLANTRLPEILDRVLSEFASADAFIRLDRLEIRIDLKDPAELEAVIVDQLPRLLRNQINKTWKKQKAYNLSRETRKDKLTGPINWLFFFLQNGCLPWSAPGNLSPPRLWSLFLQTIEKDEKANEASGALAELLSGNRNLLSRFLNQFGSAAAWEILIRQKAHLEEVKNELPQRYQDLLAQSEHPDALVLWSLLLENPGRSWEQQVATFLSKPLDRNMEKPEVKMESDTATIETPIYIPDAGLILLHPFIRAFLEKLELLRDDSCVDPAKAASLLHSLVWGEAPTAEWQLVLPKVLLGVPIATTLNCQAVSQEELSIGNGLLQAVIQHWSALGNTSIAGFRESFLQREGRLQWMEEEWHLVVQQKSYDMLLVKLPWGISLIKLPWMPQVLRVQWV